MLALHRGGIAESGGAYHRWRVCRATCRGCCPRGWSAVLTAVVAGTAGVPLVGAAPVARRGGARCCGCSTAALAWLLVVSDPDAAIKAAGGGGRNRQPHRRRSRPPMVAAARAHRPARGLAGVRSGERRHPDQRPRLQYGGAGRGGARSGVSGRDRACPVESSRRRRAGSHRWAGRCPCGSHRPSSVRAATGRRMRPRSMRCCGGRAFEVVCLAGYMRLLTPVLVDAWARPHAEHVHPSLLPSFPRPAYPRTSVGRPA